MVHDNTARSLFGIGYGLNYENKIFQDERLGSCNDEHRKNTLESIALYYQLFKTDETSAEEVNTRQESIWAIFDKYYFLLSEVNDRGESDMTWRLYLARMDRRKMKPTIEEADGNLIISFNPQIETDLSEFSDASLQETNKVYEYTTLLLWAKRILDDNGETKENSKYEDCETVIREVKEVIEIMNDPHAESFRDINSSIPGLACSALVKKSFKDLSEENKIFCKNVIISFASSSLRKNYYYQIFDGVESAILVLPILLCEFPEERSRIKTIIILTLFDSHSIGMYCNFCEYSKKAINNYLWDLRYDDAQSILYGYLLLRPRYEELKAKLYRQNCKRSIRLNETDIINVFY